MGEQDWSSSSSSKRILREYDFFSAASDKLIQVHRLPSPQNPDALQEFIHPELIPVPLHKEIRADSNKLMKTRPFGRKGKMVESGIVIKNATPPAMEENPNPNPNPNPPWKFHEKILEGIRGAPVFLFDKKLEDLDLLYHNMEGRLTIFKSEKVMSFLREGERRIMVERGGPVTVILTEAETALKQYKLVLVLAAKMNGTDNVLVLKDEWWRVLHEQRLKRGDLVQGWGYRRPDDYQFRLALKITRRPPSP